MRTPVLALMVVAALGGAVEAKRKSKAKAKAGASSPLSDQAVAASVDRAGWADALLLARGPGDKGPVALLRATREGKEQVLAAVAQPGAAPAKGIVLDPITSNQTRIKSTVTAFLNEPDLIDLFVEQSPPVPEGHSTVGTHFVARRRGAILTLVCRFDGGSSMSGKEGVYSGHSVVVEKVAKTRLTTFDVRVDATDSKNPGEHQSSVARWEIPAKGQCHQRPSAP
jgi:hypothetical protein